MRHLVHGLPVDLDLERRRLRIHRPPSAARVEPVRGHLRGDRLGARDEQALADLLAAALDRRVDRARVLLALAQRVLHVDHAQARRAPPHELRDAVGGQVEAREVLVLGLVQPAERVELVTADVWAEHLAKALEGAWAERDPFVLRVVEVGRHVEIEEEPGRKQGRSAGDKRRKWKGDSRTGVP